MTFGEKIKALRREKRITQKELGVLLCVGEMTISGYETGSREPNFETLRKLAEIFSVTIDFLLIDEVVEPIVRDENHYWKSRALLAEDEVRSLTVTIQKIKTFVNKSI